MRKPDRSHLPSLSLLSLPSRHALLDDRWKSITDVDLVPGRGTRCPPTSPLGPQVPLYLGDSNSAYFLYCSEKGMDEFILHQVFAQGLVQAGTYSRKLVILDERYLLLSFRLPSPPGLTPPCSLTSAGLLLFTHTRGQDSVSRSSLAMPPPGSTSPADHESLMPTEY